MRKLMCAAAILLVCQSVASAAENVKVRQALETLDKALAAEAQRLQTAKKAPEANEVLAIQKLVQDQLMPLANPGKCAELRSRLFLEELASEWKIPFNPDRFVITPVQTPQGMVMKVKCIAPTGGVSLEGTLTLLSDDSAEIKWTNAMIWKVYAAGKGRLLVDEYIGGVRKTDGIILTR